MIAFSCSCGQKFKVKPEYAGRSAKCPTCKQPLTVPQPETAVLPAGPIDGPPSSLHDGGVEGGVTLESAARSGHKTVGEVLAQRVNKSERYLIEDEIARGGMGAVLRAVDCDIRREVAVKFLLDQADPKKKLRFIEEAQITGQLEHPNIPPVHELGVDKQKHLFFSMKMVKGRSLAQVLDELRQEPKTAEKKYPLARLLTIFVNICNALDYAHARGVVHRDLKPANIMVGDFGEVYVMDWGLAKVLASGGRPPPGEAPATDSAASPGGLRPPLAASIMTSREAEADLTQDGAILGTPAYMPPEQAAGHLTAVDQRSDVYSLGAILYEILTLQAPVEKEGGYLEVLMRAVQGAILTPEQRAPERVRKGKVPRELSAVAMKALAREPAQRYPSVAALRRDVELYQEGRSVSAKQDTTREMLWKLIKRNKAASAVLFVLLPALVVLCGFTLTNYWAYAREHRDKEKRTTRAVPALVVSARLMANDGQFGEALEQTEVVLDYDAGNVDARLLRGQIFIGQKNWSEARAELAAYLGHRPGDADAQKLAELCGRSRMDDPMTLLAVAEVLQRQRAYGPAAPLLHELQRLVESRKALLALYQKQIDAGLHGLGNRLSLNSAGLFQLDFSNLRHVTTLAPLKGVPVNRLILGNCDGIQDLAPLQGMPLVLLSAPNLRLVHDLAPLRGMPLQTLQLSGCELVEDLSPLHGMPLTELYADYTKVQVLTPLRGMPLTRLSLASTRVHDLTPLHGMKLTTLSFRSCGLVQDLAPLKGMPLTFLDLVGCGRVEDLTPLKGMPLTILESSQTTRIKDLTPLQGMPLVRLSLGSGVSDLRPLDGLKLEEINFWLRGISRGLEVLRAMKSLRVITPQGYGSFTPAEFWKKYDAGDFTR